MKLINLNPFKYYNPLYDAEIDAEINMLRNVLDAAGITSKTDEWFNQKAEYRTWLISQLKHVPDIIKELKEEIKADNISKMNGGN